MNRDKRQAFRVIVLCLSAVAAMLIMLDQALLSNGATDARQVVVGILDLTFYLFPNSIFGVFPYYLASGWTVYASIIAIFVFVVGPLAYGMGYALDRLRSYVGYVLSGLIYLVFSFLFGVLTIIYVIETA
jgi:hypothetical protein